MTYKIEVERKVINILDQIDNYCIEHYNNYSFGKKLFKEIVKIQEIIKENPKMYIEIKPNHYKVILIKFGYNLYYKVDRLKRVIIIYNLKSFKQKQ